MYVLEAGSTRRSFCRVLTIEQEVFLCLSDSSVKEKVLGRRSHFQDIRPKKKTRGRKERPSIVFSEADVNELFEAIKNFEGEGYPRLRDLRKMMPSLTPLQLNVTVRFLERSGMIILDSESNIVWARKHRDQDRLTLGDVAEISSDLKEFLNRNPE